MSDKAWVTLATNDTYSLGALVLAHSLRRVKTSHSLVILITPGVTPHMRSLLYNVFNEVREVNILDSKDEKNLALLQRPELGITFTKLHCWKLTHYNKCVFLDADTLVLKNCDELFDREELSAAPDVGWPDCFNTGVFVFKPSEETFEKLINFALTHGSFDGGDQGLLNMFFSDWSTADISRHLPFVYNLCSAAIYSYLPAFRWFGKDIKIIHFISGSKPWLQNFNTQNRLVQAPVESPHLKGLLQIWWDLFCTHVHPSLSTEMGGLAASFSKMKLDEPIGEEQLAIEDQLRRQNWEQGNVDYLGKDSFDNILQKIKKTMSSFEESDEKASEAQPEEEDKPLQFTVASETEKEVKPEASEVIESAPGPQTSVPEKQEDSTQQTTDVPDHSKEVATKTSDASPDSATKTKAAPEEQPSTVIDSVPKVKESTTAEETPTDMHCVPKTTADEEKIISTKDEKPESKTEEKSADKNTTEEKALISDTSKDQSNVVCKVPEVAEVAVNKTPSDSPAPAVTKVHSSETKEAVPPASTLAEAAFSSAEKEPEPKSQPGASDETETKSSEGVVVPTAVAEPPEKSPSQKETKPSVVPPQQSKAKKEGGKKK